MKLAVSAVSFGATDSQQPRLSPTFFLGQLTRATFMTRSATWKACLIEYGRALVDLQRAERLVRIDGKPDSAKELAEELRNKGHQNWNAVDYPDTLLMEVESGLVVREVQESIAAEMRSPPSRKNTTLQLHMGEGKSSVIVPIVAAALADGSQLVRVVVAKPQSKQMAQMLVSKLGGLLNRRVYYLPISRAIKLDVAGTESIKHMLHECMTQGGILLVQPEHILSFQLMGIESYINGKTDVGKCLIQMQDSFEASARDIVDESDENFSVKFELIYTMGTQRQLEMTPDRWLYIQAILSLVQKFAPAVSAVLPGAVSLREDTKGRFPRIRLLRPEGGDLLVTYIATEICEYGLEAFPIVRQPAAVRKAVLLYITKPELHAHEIVEVEQGPFWTDNTRDALLLLRGLLAGGVIAFGLGQKRWRVNYGLTPERRPATRLAVPYRAKDSPAPRSEFSHPDIVILLTCLSYYYGGLDDDDLYTSLSHLAKSDQANLEYQAWMKNAEDVPIALTNLEGVNIHDKSSCKELLFPSIRHGKSIVDYFLSHIVFAKDMKEFPQKLSASGWDLGKEKSRPMTGFSGTNDSRSLLPLAVDHLDLPAQKHTNALVLEYLLQPENSVELMPTTLGSDAVQLLQTVFSLDHEAQVILDVGAHIIEMSNLEVATSWLKMYGGRKDAAVFCNDRDEVCVVDGSGHVELLQTSSFLSRLDVCLVFLDEAHTRGIDLRLPRHFRAAVTLGAGLTKDRLTQACMRMRKLGQGQTVVFCIPEEIQNKIRECLPLDGSTAIEVSHVLTWTIHETYSDIRRSMPLWAVQGERFVRQQHQWMQVINDGKTNLTTAYAEEFQEPESQTIEQRYRPGCAPSASVLAQLNESSDNDLARIVARCSEFDDLQFSSTALREEQERELSPEIEQERQVQNPAPAEAAKHTLHDDVLSFWRHGTLLLASKAYRPAFEALVNTTAASCLDLKQLSHRGDLLVTADFATTIVRASGKDVLDWYQRHVQWILTLQTQGTGIVKKVLLLSPFEANALRDRKDRSDLVTMHLYKPRCNSAYPSLDKLDFHTIPQRSNSLIMPRPLAMMLNVFAGQLYLSTYDDYLEVCELFGLAAESLTAEMSNAGWVVAADGFIQADGSGRCGGESGLKQSPVQFLKVLLSTIRRNGVSISKTHLGSLLEAKLFKRADFEE
jgi:hypothetical protein